MSDNSRCCKEHDNDNYLHSAAKKNKPKENITKQHNSKSHRCFCNTLKMTENKIIPLPSIICVITIGVTVPSETQKPTGKMYLVILENNRIILSHESLCGYFVSMLTVRKPPSAVLNHLCFVL